MPKPYSYDLRTKVIEAIELDGLKKSEVSEIFNVSRNTINLWLRRKAETGDYQAQSTTHISPNRKIKDGQKFQEFVKANGDKTQAEMAELWQEEISARTISRALKQIGFTRKKKTYGYRERDENKRLAFLKKLTTLAPEKIVYADEAGMDNREDYAYGYNERGQRFYALKPGRRQGRVNMIAARCLDKLIAPFTVEGSCNRTVFETWLKNCLLPVLQPGQILVIDNATFHKGGEIEDLLAQVGCRVLYLPPYSPDLNKIEKCWSWLKSRIRKCISDFDCLRDAMDSVLKKAS